MRKIMDLKATYTKIPALVESILHEKLVDII